MNSTVELRDRVTKAKEPTNKHKHKQGEVNVERKRSREIRKL